MPAETDTSSIEGASDEIKLAVELIYLFESNHIDTQVALSALAIVTADLRSKLSKG
mgnify:FL=1